MNNIFDNLKSFAQVQSFKSKINKKYGCKLDNGDIHRIFENLNIPFRVMNVQGMNIKYYNRDSVIECYYNGYLIREIQKILSYRTPKTQTPKIDVPGNGKSVIVNATDRYYSFKEEPKEDDYEYANGENNMEKYSEYLINNVYEEKKNMNKITINENDIKTLVNESIKKILKEEYWNYDLKNELRNCNTLYRKLYDFLEYMQFAHVDDMDNAGDNDIPLYKVMCSGYHLLEDLADFRQDRERKRMKK